MEIIIILIISKNIYTETKSQMKNKSIRHIAKRHHVPGDERARSCEDCMSEGRGNTEGKEKYSRSLLIKTS